MSKTYPKSPRNHLPRPAALCQGPAPRRGNDAVCVRMTHLGVCPLGYSKREFSIPCFPFNPAAPQQAVGSFNLKLLGYNQRTRTTVTAKWTHQRVTSLDSVHTKVD